jgi:hypothetical protein
MTEEGKQSTVAGRNAPNWERGSRPSKTNCTSDDTEALPTQEGTWRGYWWKQKNELVNRFIEEYPDRAARPISVRGGELLREECTMPRQNDEKPRSASWSTVLNEFLKWYNGYRHSHLVYNSPDGERVRARMPNAHQPQYGDKYYARLKALERQIVAEYEDLHIAMLSFTGSTKNANGGWRCVADHLRDVIDSFRPDRGRGVYHTLRDSLSEYRWEYALVVEKHQSGYGHVHCAVFVDGEIEESDFHSAIDAHLRECNIAHRDAHDYYAEDEETRPISIRSVNTDLDPNQDDVDEIMNVGSYIGEYIGAHGEPLFERSLEELAFRAAVWATGTQLVRFSNGANEMINSERDTDESELDDVAPVTAPKSSFDPDAENPGETVDGAPVEVIEGEWSIEGVGRVDDSGEEIHDMHRKGIEYVEIDDASHLDPPSQQPPDTPKPRTYQSELPG